MFKTLRNKWIKALKSGRYKQGTGSLHITNPDEYCCLGVLCKVAKINSAHSTEPHGRIRVAYDGLDTNLTTNLLIGFGISYSEHGDLVEMNDINRCGFDVIADWIERHL